jgi:hypothetical protein
LTLMGMRWESYVTISSGGVVRTPMYMCFSYTCRRSTSHAPGGNARDASTATTRGSCCITATALRGLVVKGSWESLSFPHLLGGLQLVPARPQGLALANVANDSHLAVLHSHCGRRAVHDGLGRLTRAGQQDGEARAREGGCVLRGRGGGPRMGLIPQGIAPTLPPLNSTARSLTCTAHAS